jgi:hypothetical protein
VLRHCVTVGPLFPPPPLQRDLIAIKSATCPHRAATCRPHFAAIRSTGDEQPKNATTTDAAIKSDMEPRRWRKEENRQHHGPSLWFHGRRSAEGKRSVGGNGQIADPLSLFFHFLNDFFFLGPRQFQQNGWNKTKDFHFLCFGGFLVFSQRQPPLDTSFPYLFG